MYIFTGILLLSLLVLFDARRLGLEKGQMRGILDMSYTEWFIACIGLGILALPFYALIEVSLKKVALLYQNKCPYCQEEIDNKLNSCMKEGKKEVAITMLKDGMNIEKIAKFTNLDMGEIELLKKGIQHCLPNIHNE